MRWRFGSCASKCVPVEEIWMRPKTTCSPGRLAQCEHLTAMLVTRVGTVACERHPGHCCHSFFESPRYAVEAHRLTILQGYYKQSGSSVRVGPSAPGVDVSLDERRLPVPGSSQSGLCRAANRPDPVGEPSGRIDPIFCAGRPGYRATFGRPRVTLERGLVQCAHRGVSHWNLPEAAGLARQDRGPGARRLRTRQAQCREPPRPARDHRGPTRGAFDHRDQPAEPVNDIETVAVSIY